MASHNYHQSSHSSAFSPPNPLRPYYIPPASPSVDNLSTTTSSLPGNVPTSYGIIQDFQDYSSDYLESPSISEAMRSFLDQAILKYTAVLISQPFEVAKTVLQCQYVPKSEGKLKNGTGAATADEDDDEGDDEENGCDNEEENKSEEENPWQFDDDEDSEEEQKYFASMKSPNGSPALRPTKVASSSSGPKKMTDRAGYILEDQEKVPRPDYQIKKCGTGSVNEVLKSLWAKEGAWGIWKGTNATFVHSLLVTTVDAWSTSFLSAILSLPDPGVTEIADSTHPMASLGVAIAASTLTALLLGPLDMIRTKLILTPSNSNPRRLIPALRTLPSYVIPTQLILPTTLHAAIPSLISLGTPYFLKTRFNLDTQLTPISFSICAFLSSTVELFARLPLETVLRRAQITATKPERLVVPVGRYAGFSGTAWALTKEEETGKWGIEGLYRGWRVGAWSNVGVLGLSLFGVSQGQTYNEF